jgi:hypothetical protein
MSASDVINERDTERDTATTVGPIPSGRPWPIEAFLKLFSSIWFGIWLLVFLFVYSTIGSVGVWVPGIYSDLAYRHEWVHEIYWIIPWTQFHVRQAPGLEMSEFQWFHWWPFNLNILLICLNLVVATLRRIPLNVVNLGVWMIHTGIITLCIGSVIYFATKLEGDAPIVRRALVIEVPDHPPVRLAAQPGSTKAISVGARQYHFSIMNIDPQWEMLSGEAEGRKTYAVMVAVHTPEHQFVRTLPAGYPEHVQDAIWTGNPDQPMVRAINEIGREIVDDSISLSLEYAPQEYYYLADMMESAAIYLREKGTDKWIERPIRGLPRYNDYLQSDSEIWRFDTYGEFRPRRLELDVKAYEDGDPLANVPISVTRYLRYAFMETHRNPGGPRLDPMVRVMLRSERGQQQMHELVASDSSRNEAESGRLAFRWVSSLEEMDRLARVQQPMLRIDVPGDEVQKQVPIQLASPDDEVFTEIEGTDFAYRVETVQNDLNLGTGSMVSVAVVTIRSPERTFQRWVFDDPGMPGRDLMMGAAGAMHNEELEFDRRISMVYQPGRRPAPVTIIAGPEEHQLNLLLTLPQREPTLQPLQLNQVVDLQAGISMQVLQYAPRSWAETRPRVIPAEQRERNAGHQRSMIRVDVPIAGGTTMWLPYHVYPFAHEDEVLRRFGYRPNEIELPDGRVIEIIYSRQRKRLPTRIALHNFVVSAHIGGFTGQTSSIRDWTSMVRFDRDGQWTDPEPISMNKPANYGGFWYFQAKWDPPDQPRWEGDPPSQGLNYTVLGVGNRNGVWTQLFGCVVAVVGMCYAFYIKPIIKRRRQQAVYAQVKQRQADAGEQAGGAMESRP